MALWTTPIEILGTGSGKTGFTSGKTVGQAPGWFSWAGIGVVAAALGLGIAICIMSTPAKRQQRRRPQQRKRQQSRRGQQRRRALPR